MSSGDQAVIDPQFRNNSGRHVRLIWHLVGDQRVHTVSNLSQLGVGGRTVESENGPSPLRTLPTISRENVTERISDLVPFPDLVSGTGTRLAERSRSMVT